MFYIAIMLTIYTFSVETGVVLLIITRVLRHCYTALNTTWLSLPSGRLCAAALNKN